MRNEKCKNNFPFLTPHFSFNEVFFKDVCKAVVYVKGRFIIYFIVDKALVEFNGNAVRFFVEGGKHFLDLISVEVDRDNFLHGAFIGNLIALCIETVADTSVIYDIFGTSCICHSSQQVCRFLTVTVK